MAVTTAIHPSENPVEKVRLHDHRVAVRPVEIPLGDSTIPVPVQAVEQPLRTSEFAFGDSLVLGIHPAQFR